MCCVWACQHRGGMCVFLLNPCCRVGVHACVCACGCMCVWRNSAGGGIAQRPVARHVKHPQSRDQAATTQSKRMSREHDSTQRLTHTRIPTAQQPNSRHVGMVSPFFPQRHCGRHTKPNGTPDTSRTRCGIHRGRLNTRGLLNSDARWGRGTVTAPWTVVNREAFDTQWCTCCRLRSARCRTRR